MNNLPYSKSNKITKLTESFIFSSKRRNSCKYTDRTIAQKNTDREIPVYILKDIKLSFGKLTKERALYFRYLGKP